MYGPYKLANKFPKIHDEAAKHDPLKATLTVHVISSPNDSQQTDLEECNSNVSENKYGSGIRYSHDQDGNTNNSTDPQSEDKLILTSYLVSYIDIS